MGWFPGYVINLETGERLNIIFSEDSWLAGENGRDMKWNPTSNLVTEDFPFYSASSGTFSGGSYLLGGKHFIYVMGGDASVMAEDDYIEYDLSPSYDEGAWIYHRLSDTSSSSYEATIAGVFQHATWVGAPLLSSGNFSLFGKGQSNTARVKLRVNSSYNPYVNVDESQILNQDDNLVIGNTYFVADNNIQPHNYKLQLTRPKVYGGKKITHDGNDYQVGETFVATTSSFSGSSKARVIGDLPVNNFDPMYQFNTSDLISERGNSETAVNALDLINVVPNPYYGYSKYETSQLDNRIKVTNLPKKATVRIYTVSGTLVKTIKKSDDLTSVDWDLKNDFGIPIASGLYIIHVRTMIDGKEENKILKWFGVLRPIDLDTF